MDFPKLDNKLILHQHNTVFEGKDGRYKLFQQHLQFLCGFLGFWFCLFVIFGSLENYSYYFSYLTMYYGIFKLFFINRGLKNVLA